jgi:hypothetical protein
MWNLIILKSRKKRQQVYTCLVPKRANNTRRQLLPLRPGLTIKWSFHAPLQLNKLCLELDHHMYHNNFSYIFSSFLLRWMFTNLVEEKRTHEKGAETKQDSTSLLHFLHQPLVEDASSHPWNKWNVVSARTKGNLIKVRKQGQKRLSLSRFWHLDLHCISVSRFWHLEPPQWIHQNMKPKCCPFQSTITKSHIRNSIYVLWNGLYKYIYIYIYTSTILEAWQLLKRRWKCELIHNAPPRSCIRWTGVQVRCAIFHLLPSLAVIQVSSMLWGQIPVPIFQHMEVIDLSHQLRFFFLMLFKDQQC